MRPLKIDDPIHGHKVIKMLEQYNRNEFGLFEDPYEAVANYPNRIDERTVINGDGDHHLIHKKNDKFLPK